jgi:hypothetical protein
VRHIFAQAHVSHDEETRNLAFNGARGLLNDAIVSPGSSGFLVLRFRQAEKDYRGNAERGDIATLFDGFVDRHVEHAGHGADFLADSFTRANEKRVNEAVWGEPGFANEGSK